VASIRTPDRTAIGPRAEGASACGQPRWAGIHSATPNHHGAIIHTRGRGEVTVTDLVTDPHVASIRNPDRTAIGPNADGSSACGQPGRGGIHSATTSHYVAIIHPGRRGCPRPCTLPPRPATPALTPRCRRVIPTAPHGVARPLRRCQSSPSRSAARARTSRARSWTDRSIRNDWTAAERPERRDRL
jgi:hypothetical protein